MNLLVKKYLMRAAAKTIALFTCVFVVALVSFGLALISCHVLTRIGWPPVVALLSAISIHLTLLVAVHIAQAKYGKGDGMLFKLFLIISAMLLVLLLCLAGIRAVNMVADDESGFVAFISSAAIFLGEAATPIAYGVLFYDLSTSGTDAYFLLGLAWGARERIRLSPSLEVARAIWQLADGRADREIDDLKRIVSSEKADRNILKSRHAEQLGAWTEWQRDLEEHNPDYKGLSLFVWDGAAKEK